MEKLAVPKILRHSSIKTKRQLVIYYTATFFVFAFSILAGSIAIFLQDRFPDSEYSLLFVGLILGLASIGAIFVDTYWAYLQTLRSPRKLLLWALMGLIGTVCIFLFSKTFLILTILAALLYGWSFDLYDVTVTTVILKRGNESEYAQNISQKKLAEVIGMISGLILAGFLLSIGPIFAQSVLLIILIIVLIFVAHHFDRDEDAEVELEFSKNSIVNWKEVFRTISTPRKMKTFLVGVKDGLAQEILQLSQDTADTVRDLPDESREMARKMTEGSRRKLIEILARENEIVRTAFPQKKFSFSKMKTHSIGMIGDFFALFRRDNGKKLFIIWGAIVVMFFSFWDTMAATYQPLFLGEVLADKTTLKAFSGFFLAIFILPILIFQLPFSKAADRFGRKKFVFFGIVISGLSLLFLGISSKSGNLGGIIAAGMLNSVGYALAFSPAQALFVSEVEKAQPTITKENSAGLLRIALNIGNIFGQFGGGLAFALFGFANGFFFFGALLLLFSMFSILLPILTRGQ